MPIPLGALIALWAGGQAASAVGSGVAAKKQRQSQEQLSREQLALDREQGLMNTALQESNLDPFRHQLAQANAIARLDAMEGAQIAPTTVTLPDRYAKYKPQVSGGFSWQPSADLRTSAGRLKQSVMAGRTAPSMTDPSNFGRTATLDLFSGANPRTDEAFAMGVPKREHLGGPAAPPLTQVDPNGSLRRRLSAMAKRRSEVEAFEAANPGWTIDDTGRVVRKG